MANEVTVATARRNAWKSIFTIIDNNKVSGTTVYAGFPNKQPSFPCYVIHPFQVSSSDITMGHMQDYNFEVEVEFFCTAREDRKEKIDEMKDNIMNTFIDNITTLEAQNLTLAEEWFSDDTVDSMDVNDEKFHTGSVTLYFRFY